MLGIKGWFYKLFDDCLAEEHLWGFRVLVAKRKWLIWGCKEEKRERFLLCSGVV